MPLPPPVLPVNDGAAILCRPTRKRYEHQQTDADCQSWGQVWRCVYGHTPGKTFTHECAVDITLVNRENFFWCTPMLYKVAASDLDITHIINAIRRLLHRANFFEWDVEYIDLPTSTLGSHTVFRVYGHPAGLQSPLCTLHLFCSPVHLTPPQAQHVVRVVGSTLPGGTCTPQETPRFAWRTNAGAQPLPEAGATQERTL